jgi:nitroreductase
MDFAEVLRRRRMVRAYTGDPVDPEIVERIAGSASRAPSAGWAQGVSVIAVTDRVAIAELAKACGEASYVERGFDAWLSSAGAHLVVCCEPDVYRRRYEEPDKDPAVLESLPWWWVDAGAALTAILLSTVSEGLAAGFHGGHGSDGVRPLLGIPDDVLVVGIVTVGHAAPDRRSSSLDRPRRNRVHHGRW